MTPADFAAALGVDVESVKVDTFGDAVVWDGLVRWSVDSVPPSPGRRHALRYVDASGQISITIPITTTLKAAVAHVRAMLAVEPKEPTP